MKSPTFVDDAGSVVARLSCVLLPAARAGSTGAMRRTPRARSFARIVGSRPRRCRWRRPCPDGRPVAASLSPGARVVLPDVEFTSRCSRSSPRSSSGAASAAGSRGRSGRGDRRAAPTSSRSAPCRSRYRRGRRARRDRRGGAAHGALTVVDATQAIGWLPLDARASTSSPAPPTSG